MCRSSCPGLRSEHCLSDYIWSRKDLIYGCFSCLLPRRPFHLLIPTISIGVFFCLLNNSFIEVEFTYPTGHLFKSAQLNAF